MIQGNEDRMNLREKVEALAEALGPSEQTERSVTNNIDLPDSQIKEKSTMASYLPSHLNRSPCACMQKEKK